MSRRSFRLMVVGANVGRGYGPGVYAANVERIVRHVRGFDHYALLWQEVDEEPDPANEHRKMLSALEPKVRRVNWKSREPIVLSPSFRVTGRRRPLKIMGSGLDIGGPKGTGPERRMTRCIATAEGIDLFFATWHPHRKGLSPRVDEARDVGADRASAGLTRLAGHDGGIPGVYETDYNERDMPTMVPGERVAEHRGLDHMRYVPNGQDARLRLLDHGTLRGTIDPHWPLWALFEVSARS